MEGLRVCVVPRQGKGCGGPETGRGVRRCRCINPMERADMDTLLIASSPVEIEAKSEAAGLPPAVHDLALALFHELTDRLGQAARQLPEADTSWPTLRFYFADSGSDAMKALLDGLQQRADFVEVAAGAGSSPAEPAGLFVRRSRDGFTGVLVRHESHDGLPSPG